MPSARNATGHRSPGRRREGEPRVRRPAGRRVTSNPSRKEDSCPSSSRRPPRRSSCSRGSASSADRAPHRIVSLSPTATESLFAIGAGKQVIAVDDQSDYPAQAPAHQALRLHAERRGDRRLQARPRRRLLRPERARLRARAGSASACSSRTRPRTLAGAYAQIAQLGARHGPRRRGDAARRADEAADRRSWSRRHPTRARADVFHELEPGSLLGHLEARSSAGSTRCSA